MIKMAAGRMKAIIAVSKGSTSGSEEMGDQYYYSVEMEILH